MYKNICWNPRWHLENYNKKKLIFEICR